MAAMREIVFDCGRAAPLARFWAAALDGYEVRAYDEAELARVAERGRVRLDVVAADPRREGYTVMRDPEANRFCVAAPR